jgi:hydrogenase maturation protease
MERLIGYERAILIDALAAGQNPAGTVTCFPLEALPLRPAGHTRAVHDTTLQDALQVGRSLGAELPDRVEVVAIEACSLYTFSEELSPEVAAALPQAVAAVLDLLYARPDRS